MLGELGAVVEADGSAQMFGKLAELVADTAGGQRCFAVGWLVEDGEAGLPLVQDEHVLPIFGEEHVVGFPMSRLGPLFGLLWSFRDWPALLDEACRAATAQALPSAPGLMAGQQAVPVILLGRAVVDVSID